MKHIRMREWLEREETREAGTAQPEPKREPAKTKGIGRGKRHSWDDNDFQRLVDPDERDHVLKVIRETPQSETLAETIERLLCEPLERWIQAEYERMGCLHHNGTEAGLRLLTQADDIQEWHSNGQDINPESVDELGARWTMWLNVIAQGEMASKAKTLQGSRLAGRRGGRQSKRKSWAEWLARRVQSFNEIPDSESPLEYLGYDIYRDGNRVVCSAGQSDDESLAQSTFERHYLRGR